MSNVNRWHANRHATLRNSGDTIADHQPRVARLLRQFWPDAPQAAIDYALRHDAHEAIMGDIPATEKAQWCAEMRHLYRARESAVRREMDLPDCPEEWADHVTFCDRLDAYDWASRVAPEAMVGDGFPEMRADLRAMAARLGVEIWL